MRDLPHLVYLQAFEAAARHLSFTRAGQELNCTQAAISQRIRGLEQYFGRPLFHRRSNGLELSSAGKAYLPGIAQALDVMDSATRGLTGRRVQRSVTISAPISFINLWLAPRLGGFTDAHPDVGLRINSSIWTDPNVDLADISIFLAEQNLLPEGAVALAPMPLVLVQAPGQTAARRIEVQGKYPLWDLWSERASRNFDATLPPHRADTAATALRLAEQGLGSTVVYELYARDLAGAGLLQASGGVDVGHVLSFQTNSSRRPTAAVHAFMYWLSGGTPEAERDPEGGGDA